MFLQIFNIIKNIMEDDNKLVTLSDLEKDDEIITAWDNKEIVETQKNKMEKLKQLRFNTIPDEVIDNALAEIIHTTSWYNYENFKHNVNNIINGKIHVPFSLKAKDKESKKLDFWMLRTFVNVNKVPTISYNGKEYSKKEVYLSKQFNNTLRKYCKDTLKDEVQFYTYISSPHGTGQKLDLDKLSQNDKMILSVKGDSNPDDLILFQFKKKTPEVYIGKI